MLSLQERLELLCLPTWDYHNIMKYTGYKQSCACDIKRKAIKEYKGKVPYSLTQVKTDAVLDCLYNTTREKEIQLISQALNLSTTIKMSQTTTVNKKGLENG